MLGPYERCVVPVPCRVRISGKFDISTGSRPLAAPPSWLLHAPGSAALRGHRPPRLSGAGNVHAPRATRHALTVSHFLRLKAPLHLGCRYASLFGVLCASEYLGTMRNRGLRRKDVLLPPSRCHAVWGTHLGLRDRSWERYLPCREKVIPPIPCELVSLPPPPRPASMTSQSSASAGGRAQPSLATSGLSDWKSTGHFSPSVAPAQEATCAARPGTSTGTLPREKSRCPVYHPAARPTPNN